MRPYDIEPNYYEDLLISQNKLKPRNIDGEREEFHATKSEFLKKTMNEKNFAANNSTIISASPYRAVIRRKEQSEYDHQEETQRTNNSNGDDYDLGEDMEQFDRDIGNTLGGEKFRDTYTTGRQYDNANEFFAGEAT